MQQKRKNHCSEKNERAARQTYKELSVYMAASAYNIRHFIKLSILKVLYSIVIIYNVYLFHIDTRKVRTEADLTEKVY